MKTGKFIPMGHHRNIKIGYGTIDYKNLKTIYVSLTSWIIPNTVDDYDSIISKTRNEIKNYLYNQNHNLFEKESIVDFDVRTKGVRPEKKSFMSVEMTLFVKKQFDIKSKEIKSYIKDLCQTIIDDNIVGKNIFKFYQNKK
jgi:hypothetical protein